MIDLRKHSSRHLETKIILPIPESKSYEREIHYYLFSPPQLYVNKTTYSETSMLHKFQCHGRYSSPEITLEELIDEDNEMSPLVVLKNYTASLEKDVTSIPERNVVHELQTVVNSLRHENKACLQDCKDMVKLGMVKDLRKTLEDWYVNINMLKDTVRDLLIHIRTKFSPDNRVLLAFLWADEAISLLDEKEAIDLYMATSPLNAQFPVILPKLLSFSREEANYRVREQYQSGSNNPETVQYRKAVLKKWTQSALYLVPEISRWPMRVSQILAGTAAAIAMAFATLAAIFAEKTFIKNSLQWALIVIIAYVFKDRIKEWLRSFFNAVLPKMMADEISSFLSPKTGARICTSRIKLNYLEFAEIPKEVKDIRRDNNNPFADMLPKEDVIHYVRNLIMHPYERKDNEQSQLPRENNFTLVTRIRLDDFLKEMDDPNDIVFRMDPNADELDQLNSERVYHLHLVIRECSIKDDIDLYSHYCIVLNKSGIVRIEQMPDN
ncbi:hypothetical protein SpiGrapes_2955 [Sphaerochaeta pleomorpha str. Grapes]|uniref:Uncharacterized protein n=1 Tax=Sphaerochaeta pleomorpha (strain ATCC BAA-1885 / DSM 22778 / Grapes) TaxID=158190 RepID=G8QXR1_SPHPG|nr:hypothetical protein [Sphaerochaeta pleomorpha]AEV30705.1 hypothetical protein SpiGrapes_2955 [Sphaerochaeta pleomorpha str. Grapes]